jgi:hypothetical protein
MIEGGCRCGACRYALDVAELPRAYACYCRDCQTWSGSAFSLQLVLVEDAVTATGPIARFDLVNPSGHLSRQRMCERCHTRLFNTNDARPGIAVVRAGTIDRSDELDVPVHIWTSRKQPWLRLPDDAQSFAENAPPAAILGLMAR